jgi:hypothetical protein
MPPSVAWPRRIGIADLELRQVSAIALYLDLLVFSFNYWRFTLLIWFLEAYDASSAQAGR